MIICCNCGSRSPEYMGMELMSEEGREADVYYCQDCGTFLEVVPNYEILEHVPEKEQDNERETPEGMNL